MVVSPKIGTGMLLVDGYTRNECIQDSFLKGFTYKSCSAFVKMEENCSDKIYLKLANYLTILHK